LAKEGPTLEKGGTQDPLQLSISVQGYRNQGKSLDRYMKRTKPGKEVLVVIMINFELRRSDLLSRWMFDNLGNSNSAITKPDSLVVVYYHCYLFPGIITM
jgi:hypothetical protein